jgi:hypothetical protein
MDQFANWILEEKKNKHKKQILPKEDEKMKKKEISFFSKVDWQDMKENAKEFSILDQIQQEIDQEETENILEKKKVQSDKSVKEQYSMNPFDYRVSLFSSLLTFKWPLEHSPNERTFSSELSQLKYQVSSELKEKKKKNIKEFLRQRIKQKKNEMKGIKKQKKTEK